MKRIKMLVVASAAALTLVGLAVIPAAAAASNTTVCTVSTTPCPSGNLASGNISSTLAQNSVFSDSKAHLTSNTLGSVICTTSTPSGTVGTNPGAPVTGTVTPNWSGCNSSTLGVSCTVTPNSTPYNVTITDAANATPPDSNADGTFHVSSPNVKVVCGVVTCTYTATNNDASTYNPGSAFAPDTSNTHGQIQYNQVGLTSSNCLNDNGTFTANYAVTTSGGSDLWVQ